MPSLKANLKCKKKQLKLDMDNVDLPLLSLNLHNVGSLLG
jgi:hypothetical protein